MNAHKFPRKNANNCFDMSSTDESTHYFSYDAYSVQIDSEWAMCPNF